MTFCYLLSLLLATTSFDHEFKMSVCELSVAKDQPSLDVKFYLFQDDFKEALYGDPLAPELKEADATDYIQSKVKFMLDGQPLRLVFREMKMREDQAQVIFKAPLPSQNTKSVLSVSNQLLIEKFRQQTNMVYFNQPNGNKLTLILNAKKTEGEFKTGF